MAIKTYTEQLEEVQAAISAITTGAQSYSVKDRSLSRGDLKTLLEEEKRLRLMVERETNGGVRVRGATVVR